MSVDPTRHLAVFDPGTFRGRVDIIGAGATGSKVALALAKLGVENLHVWDFDVVEEHNIANQVYGTTHIGAPKVEALAAIILAATGVRITPHNARVEGGEQLGRVVFLLTDTMASRKAIWERSVRYRPYTELLVETRMGADNGRLYALSPMAPDQIALYEPTLYGDETAEVSACGASISVGPTADILAGMAVWQFMRWHDHDRGRGAAPEFEVIFGLRPFLVLSREVPTAAAATPDDAHLRAYPDEDYGDDDLDDVAF